MDIECKGCFYTVCSFVCLTEDLSEILQFLWRHGCLRKNYLCEKCGKRCAIGDKDLFFRCNRNIVETGDEKKQKLEQYQPPAEAPKDHLEGNNAFMLEGGIHPALRNNVSLPGDPLPPHLSPVHFLLSHPPIIQPIDPDPSTPHLPGGELADLDAESVQRKRPKKNASDKSKKRCNFKLSMKKGTFFEKSKLPIDTVCKFVAFWCCMKHPTQEFLRNELSLATRTVVDWSTACREICVHWARANSEKIGGEGVVVQVDEVKISHVGKGPDDHRFAFWGIEKDKEKGKLFVVPVLECDSWHLLTIVNNWILPGSVIVSSCWRSYNCLNMHDFIQQTTNHSKIFVHPPASQTDSASVKAEEVSDSQMPRFGTRRSHHLGDLAEFMFKRRYENHLERMHAFFRQIAFAYPLGEMA